MDQFSSCTSKDINVKNDIKKFPEKEDDLGDSIEDGCVNGKQGLDSQIGLEGLNMLTARDVFKMKFDSEENAYAFYNAYAMVMGFSIQKDRKKSTEGRSRKWVCSRQGVRAKKYLKRVDRLRAPRAETRVGCKAIFRVRYDVKMGEYIVTHFVSKHNHPLAAPQCVPFLWSHRSVTSADKAQTKAMRNVGISTGQIMDLMTIQSRGFDKVGFVRKDLHNIVQADRKVELKDGDVEGILGYLSAIALHDPLFFYKYDVDHENCLDKLFRADSRSRLDYAAFGDVLVFDTTYRTNAYKKSFVMLCGVSNHYTSIIFGCALLSNETTETYMWVLETLMEAMDDKDFMEARESGFQMMCEMKKCWEMRNSDKGEEKNSAIKLFGIQDPKVVKKKGNPGGPSSASKLPTARKCGNCRSIGHTKRTCKKVKAKERERVAKSTFLHSQIQSSSLIKMKTDVDKTRQGTSNA
ncbi:hypothetical protein RHMOL_Rhmol06G0161400 [Rhododendron molle]|uniref:Uncharacterized protein n=1 Tax=Rhododendron molle TaxID=49168 RepID=A0ACC0NDG3_RHOML|nr:hypothetical protein RHMOL_Rhmol06G0161400 [Rhododendron molle]